MSGRTDIKISPEIQVRWLNISISLRAGEITTDEAEYFDEKDVAIDGAVADELNLEIGDYVIIEGESTTVAKYKDKKPGDKGMGIIRIPALVRAAAEISLGESVEVEKTQVNEAERIRLAPAEEGVMMQVADPSVFADALEGKVVVEGDIITPQEESSGSSSGFFNSMFDRDIDNFDFDFGFDTKLRVLETEKDGAVEIKGSTEVGIDESAPEPLKETPEQVISDENFVEVETEPELEEKYELSTIDDLDKLDDRIGKSIFLISKFEAEDEDKHIYFTEDHFFKWKDE